jgi:hypothetical protein
VVLLAQSLYRINARLHRLRQPIRQVSRLLASGIVQVKTGDCALHGLIVTDYCGANNTINLEAAYAIFYWARALKRR